MQPKIFLDKILGHMSNKFKLQLSRASESETVTWRPFSIVAAPQFTERLKQLCEDIEGEGEDVDDNLDIRFILRWIIRKLNYTKV